MEKEINDLKKTFIALAVIVVAVGVLFLAVITIALMHISNAVEKAPAQHYNFNCLTEVKDRPLEECRE